MVKVELSYNPYLLETDIKFNGSSPMVNSVVEKYKEKRLQNWMSKIPRIFYDEMNGYDFDLEFSGTKFDFEQLSSIFLESGVTKEKVRMIHKNELESVLKKNLRLGELLKWIKANENRKFNFCSFKENYIELFENSYSLYIVNGIEINSQLLDQYKVKIELINNKDELPNEFYGFPILFDISFENYKESLYILRLLINQSEISSDQLFFKIHDQVDKQIMVRTIKDLGVSKPKIVNDILDVKILNYLEIYPITTYIQTSILIMENELNRIKKELSFEIEKSMADNEFIYKEIDKLDSNLNKLKVSYDKFIELENLQVAENINKPAESFISKLENWRKRKFRINSDDDASEVINSLIEESRKFYNEYLFDSYLFFENQISNISGNLNIIYENAEYYDHYTPQIKPKLDLNEFSLRDLNYELKACRKVNLVEKSPEIRDIFNTLTKKSINNHIEMVEQVSFLYNDFRAVVKSEFHILSNQITNLILEVLSDYYTKMIEAYILHLTNLITELNRQKEEITLRLSKDEQELQNDKNWLTDFEDQLNLIERG